MAEHLRGVDLIQTTFMNVVKHLLCQVNRNQQPLCLSLFIILS